jgi:hypothetical protein
MPLCKVPRSISHPPAPWDGARFCWLGALKVAASSRREAPFLGDALRARNERAERDIQVKGIERDMALRQEEAEAEYERQRALADQADANGGYEQVQGVGSTGLLFGAPARVGHFSTRHRTQFRIGSSRPIHH